MTQQELKQAERNFKNAWNEWNEAWEELEIARKEESEASIKRVQNDNAERA